MYSGQVLDGVKTDCNNRSWLLRKLTGQKEAAVPVRDTSRSPASSGSAGECKQRPVDDKRKGATIVHKRVAGANFLPLHQVQAMSTREKQAAFLTIYGNPTASGNIGWLERKLTGNCKGRAAKHRRWEY